jgi:hypothetical protein
LVKDWNDLRFFPAVARRRPAWGVTCLRAAASASGRLKQAA